jgi:tetratricopeptide (TPR) repeat protein
MRLAPDNPFSHFNLGSALLERGLPEEAFAHFKESLRINPRFSDARVMLGNCLVATGEFESAVAQFRSAMAHDARSLGAINGLAWLLATCPKDKIRDGAEAIRLAETACKATGYQDPILMGTLAAAYAETGRMAEAVAAATNALNRLESKDGSLARKLRHQLQSYQQGKAYRSLPSRS